MDLTCGSGSRKRTADRSFLANMDQALATPESTCPVRPPPAAAAAATAMSTAVISGCVAASTAAMHCRLTYCTAGDACCTPRDRLPCRVGGG